MSFICNTAMNKINYLHNERNPHYIKVFVLRIPYSVDNTAKNVVVRIHNKMYLKLQSKMCISTQATTLKHRKKTSIVAPITPRDVFLVVSESASSSVNKKDE